MSLTEGYWWCVITCWSLEFLWKYQHTNFIIPLFIYHSACLLWLPLCSSTGTNCALVVENRYSEGLHSTWRALAGPALDTPHHVSPSGHIFCRLILCGHLTDAVKRPPLYSIPMSVSKQCSRELLDKRLQIKWWFLGDFLSQRKRLRAILLNHYEEVYQSLNVVRSQRAHKWAIRALFPAGIQKHREW